MSRSSFTSARCNMGRAPVHMRNGFMLLSDLVFFEELPASLPNSLRRASVFCTPNKRSVSFRSGPHCFVLTFRVRVFRLRNSSLLLWDVALLIQHIPLAIYRATDT